MDVIPILFMTLMSLNNLHDYYTEITVLIYSIHRNRLLKIRSYVMFNVLL